MNYLQTPIYSSENRPRSRQVKQLRKLVQFQQNNRNSQQNCLNHYSKDIQTSKVKSSHGNRLRPLIKINKNLQNAFPQNFFSASKPSISSTDKKHPILNKKCLELNLEPIQSFSSSFCTISKQIGKYQSIELKKPTFIDSSFIYQTLDSSQSPERLKIKPIQSLRTSIQRKHNITFSIEKNNQECLPQTAQTLENTEEEELFNITFGNGFSKQKTPNGSEVELQRGNQKGLIQIKDRGAIRIKNAVSLQLKRGEDKRSVNTSRQNSCNKRRILYESGSGSMTERRQTLSKELSQRRKIFIPKQEENPFMKIRLDMEQILSKKTTMFPRVNSQHTKRQKIPKLEKLFF